MRNINVIDVVGRGTGVSDSILCGVRLRGVGGVAAGGVAPSPTPVADAAFPAVQMR